MKEQREGVQRQRERNRQTQTTRDNGWSKKEEGLAGISRAEVSNQQAASVEGDVA